MKHLLLMRHAKSSWSNPGLSDFDRPLNERGHKAAARMAQYLVHENLLPNMMYCSTSQRTRETLGYLLESFSHECDVEMKREIYLAPCTTIRKLIHGTASAVKTLLIIGHNPGMEELALALAGSGNTECIAAMQHKFPTAALAHLSMKTSSWSEIDNLSCHLEKFIRPKAL